MDLVSRVKAILLKPNDTWPEIKNEPATVKDLFTSYAAILAAIPPIASFIGFSLDRHVRFRVPLSHAFGVRARSFNRLLCLFTGGSLFSRNDH